jgi:hypothetical protein
MILADLLACVTDKSRFQSLDDYISFCEQYLMFIDNGLQARIVSQNETYYQFFQYRADGGFNITRPINTQLMLVMDDFKQVVADFRLTLAQLQDSQKPSDPFRHDFVRVVYTLQQAIGVALDGLPVGKSNQARKLNGDLFERLIRLLITALNVECVAGTMQVPVKASDGAELFKASYQHDLLISKNDELKVIGSVKTSSKDRIDKVFMDKFLYSRLTETALPHIAIFLNDVQRKKTKRENEYAINSTFLSGHFKAYTIKLNPLDGVYYCDIRPNMLSDALLAQQIKTIDHFFFDDLWSLLLKQGQSLYGIAIADEAREDTA